MVTCLFIDKKKLYIYMYIDFMIFRLILKKRKILYKLRYIMGLTEGDGVSYIHDIRTELNERTSNLRERTIKKTN